MSFEIKSVEDLVGQVQSDLASFAPADQHPTMQWITIDGTPRLNDYYVFGHVVGMGLFELQGFVGWSVDQYMPDTGSADWLERWGSVLSPGIARHGKTAANGFVVVTGVSDSIIPPGTQFQDQQGQTFTSLQGRVIASDGETLVPVQSDVLGGTGNLSAGSPMSLVGSVPGVDASSVVGPLGLNGGGDEETDDALKTRISHRLQSLPSTGSVDDLITWAYNHPS